MLVDEWVGGWLGDWSDLLGMLRCKIVCEFGSCGTSTVVVTASMGRGVAVWADVMLLQRLGVKVLDVGAPRFGVKNESAILLRCSCC